MNDAPKLTPEEHILRVMPYLKDLGRVDPEVGLGIAVIDKTWPHKNSPHFQTAAQIRQSMYIGGLAEKKPGKQGPRLHLTQAGRNAIGRK